MKQQLLINIIKDTNLTPTERLVYALIIYTDINECKISNKEIGKKIGISETWVSKIVSSLIKKNYIKFDWFDGRQRILKGIKKY